ncbi:MAG: hypothetical protein KC656_15820 [Myxococcales bacterium]|nr:hypothetical protein [Myxococcales bacterium]MCB9669067.1 hypothetical protein [Alphaproteobacteria bacterium]MCB9694297.1 hypothetical protein [Alphaproteobacteria bacterium]
MILAALAGCVGDVEPRGPCVDAPAGGFELLEAGGLGSFDGQVWDAPEPGERPVAEVHGDCELLVLPSCPQGCAAGEVCRAGGVCEAFPTPVELGRLTLSGDLPRVRLDPLDPGALYTSGVDVPEPGARIRLVGRDLALGTVAVASMTGGPTDLRLQAGVPLDVSWDAGSAGDDVVLTLAVDQHGASQAALRCTFGDVGSGVVPASAVDALLARGVSGFPSASLARTRVDHTDVQGGCVELSSRSVVPVDLDLQGGL